MDEANFCFYQGIFLMDASSFRQAVEQFERVKALAPDYPGIDVRVAQARLKSRTDPDAGASRPGEPSGSGSMTPAR